MSIANELTKLNTAKVNIKSAIEEKGVSLSGVPFTNYHSKIAEISGEGGGGDSGSGYYRRPSDWLPLPTISSGEQKIAILVAVFDIHTNIARINVTGAYTVDWGDGIVENFASNAVAEHTYNYSDISPSTECSRGYRQAIIVITPQTGQNLTKLNLYNGTDNSRYKPFLDVRLAGQYINSLSVRSCSLLEQLEFIGSSSITSFSTTFMNCYSLQSILSLNTSKATTFADAFNNCYSLPTIPLLDTSKVISFSNTFNNCYSLKSIPAINTSKGQYFTSFVAYCASLREIPVLDLSSAGDSLSGLTLAFTGCYSLSRVRAVNIKYSISFSTCFLGAPAIVEIFNNLSTIASGTINISNQIGASLLTTEQRAIATAKGWTITG